MINSNILVLHVKKGYEIRKEHMDRMLGERNYPFEYILDGDKDDLTEEFISQHFSSYMASVSSATSCAAKHIFAYQYIVDHHLDGALILEDDMLLYDDFEEIFNRSLEEARERQFHNYLISYEDSSLHFVPRSQRVKGYYLYPQKKDRFTGAYYCPYETAAAILDYIRDKKCDLAIDLFHTSLIERIGLNYLWCQPCLATQGSHTGMFASSITTASAQKVTYRKFTWKLKLMYKKLLYFLR